MTGLYRPGTSRVHRAPAGLLLGLLLAGTTTLLVLRSPRAVAVGAVVVLGGYLLAGLGPGTCARQAWTLRWFLLLLVPYQLWVGGWRAVVVVAGGLLVAVVGAALVTLTTRVSELLEVFVRALGPLRVVGVDPERAGLVLALTVRALPVLGRLAREVQDARRARGQGRSVRAFATPVVIGTLRHADRLGEALAARGVDDD